MRISKQKTTVRLALFALLLSVLGYSNISAQISDNHQPNIYADEFTPKGGNFGWQEGFTVANLEFNDVNNKKFKLYDLLDKPVILEFWTLDCQACNKNKTYLKSFFKMYDINVVGIVTDDYPNEIRKRVKAQGVTWPTIHDDNRKFNGSTFAEAQQMGNPAFILLMPDKTVAKVFTQPEDVKKLGVHLQQYFNK